MRAHRQCMHARIGAASGMDLRFAAADLGNRFLNGLLHRRAMHLPLPAHIGRAVKFDGEREAGHFMNARRCKNKVRPNSPSSQNTSNSKSNHGYREPPGEQLSLEHQKAGNNSQLNQGKASSVPANDIQNASRWNLKIAKVEIKRASEPR